MNEITQSLWLNRLRKLNPNRSKAKGAAPHKPCLLLSLLDMAHDGELETSEITRSPGLHVRFNAFASLTLPRWGGKVDLNYPFFYLKSQGFWQVLDADGRPAAGVDSANSIRLDPEFRELLGESEFCRRARIILLETYFPPEERLSLYSLLGVRVQTPEFKKELLLLKGELATRALDQGRSARFGVQVVCGYHHTCALTGYRIITRTGESGVEAAHIEPWAKSRNDDVHNGLALSRNVHWAFDRGLWSVDNQFRILIQPDRFQEWGPGNLGLAKYHGQPLQFAPQAAMRPRSEYLRRHRVQWGFE